MRFIEIPALITEDIEDPSIVDITEPISASISGTTMTINGQDTDENSTKLIVSGEATVTLTGDTTVNAFTLQNIRAPSLHKISVKTNGKGNFTYVPNDTVTASSLSTTSKTGSDFEILLITTPGNPSNTYVDFDMADYTSPAVYTSNALTGFNVSELTSTYGATAKLYKPDGTLLTTVNSATTGSGVNFGYTESLPGDVEYKLEVTDDLGRKSTYNLPRKWINYAMGTGTTPGFQKFRLEGTDDDYTTTVMFPSLGSSSTAKVYRTSDHGYMGINFKIQGRDDPSGAWTDIANADEDDEVLAFGNYKYQRVWVKPTAKATTTVSSSNVVTLTLTDFTEENVTTSFTGADPYDINESTNTYVFEETTKIGTVPFTVTLGSETYTNAVSATTEGTAYDYVTLAFANPTLSLTTSNVTISSAKLYRDDVLFHTYGTETKVVLRSDQTGTYQAIVNDVYYSNRVTPDFTTTRSVSAPQLEFDGYNRLNLSNSTPTSTTLGLPDGTTRDLTTQSNVYIYETGTYTANVQTSDTFAYLSNVVTSQPSQNSADVGPTFTFDGYNRLAISNLTQTSSTLKYGSNTYDTNTASNVYVTDAGEYILEAKDANTFVISNVYVGAVSQHPSDVVPTLTFDGYNKLTIDNVDTVETATIKKDGAAFATTSSDTVYIRDTGTYTAEVKGSNAYAIELSTVVTGTVSQHPTDVVPSLTYDNYNKITLENMNYEDTATVTYYSNAYNLGTAKTMYVKDTGEYVFKISGTDKYVESNVYVSSVDLAGAPTKPIDFDGYNKLTLIDAGSNVSANVTYFSNTYELGSANVLYINGAGTYDLEMSGSNVFALSSNVVGTVSQQHPTDVVPSLTFDNYNKLTLENFTTSESDTRTAKLTDPNGNTYSLGQTQNDIYIEDTGEYILEVTNSDQSAVVTKNVGTVSQHPTDAVPSLTFDTYNKLSIGNLTPNSSSLRFGSNTYDIGTASNVYIEDTGTYKVATGDATTFALVSNVVTGTPSQHPTDVVPSLTYDNANKLSIENLTPTSTTLTDPNGSSFDIGTASNVYIRDSGTYSIASKDANTFVLASNTVTGTPTGTTYVYDSNTFTTPSQTYDTTKTITVSNVPSTQTGITGKIYKGSTAYPIHTTTSSSNVIIKNTGTYVSVFTTATQAFLTNAIGVTTQPTTTSDDTTIEDAAPIVTTTVVGEPLTYKAYLKTGINVNASTSWTAYDIFGSGYSEEINQGGFTLANSNLVAPETGYYRLSFNIYLYGTGAGGRTNVGVKPIVEGTDLNEISASNYIRVASGHTEASTSMSTVIHLTGNKEVNLKFARLTDTTTSVTIQSGSFITLEKVKISTLYKAYLKTGINVNASTSWTAYDIFGSGYSEEINQGGFTLANSNLVAPETGYYRLSFNIYLYGTGAGGRTNVGVKPIVEGTDLNEISASNYIRVASGHTEASTSMSTVIHLTGNKEVNLKFARLTDTTTSVTIQSGSF